VKWAELQAEFKALPDVLPEEWVKKCCFSGRISGAT